MKVDIGTSYLYNMSQRTLTPAAHNNSASFSATMAAVATEESTVVKKADFTNMTRQGMRDWVNDQIRSGVMSLDGTETLVAMTAFAHIGGEQTLADSRIQNERVNFFDVVQNGIDFYRSRGDSEAEQRLQKTLSILQQAQGQVTRFDARV